MLLNYHSLLLFCELGGRGHGNSIICCYDGSALGFSSCSICNREFNDKRYYCIGGSAPICDKLYEYVKDHEAVIRIHYKLKFDQQIVPNRKLLERAQNTYPKVKFQ